MEQALDTEYKLFLMGDFNVNMLVAGNTTFKGLLQRLNQRNVVKKTNKLYCKQWFMYLH